jgi:hypothetical protein
MAGAAQPKFRSVNGAIDTLIETGIQVIIETNLADDPYPRGPQYQIGRPAEEEEIFA